MTSTVAFAPLLPWPLLVVLAAASGILLIFAIWRGLSGWWLRALAALVLLAALANPSLRQELRDPLPDVALIVLDETSSQTILPRAEQLAEAREALLAQLEALSIARAEDAPIEWREVRVRDGAAGAVGVRDRGTALLRGLADAAAEVPPGRLAGAIVVTDGRAHDPELLTTLPAPVHVLLTGTEEEWDRRLVVETAPAFAIVGEPVTLRLRVESLGEAPSADETLTLTATVDGGAPVSAEVPVNRSFDLPLEIAHGGPNVLQFSIPADEEELTGRNNTAIVSINGVRDRLRVLLISGEPHAGERTWRNLLKADASVDLVHFTILRPPEKQDGVPVNELSLIEFPTRELFLEKIDEFDLIIFDRYRRRGVLPSAYLENIARYINDGGAVLVAAGPAFAGAESLYRTSLSAVLPAFPTARVVEGGFRPEVTDVGGRHPVTDDLLEVGGGPDEEGRPPWGRWFRLIELEVKAGHTLMAGAEGLPLLVLDRPGEGRIALLASDHAWLWSRGYEGGGPQGELLRRVAHWLMQEPELEEEVLSATAAGPDITVTRRSLDTEIGDLELLSPSGERQSLPFQEVAPGRWQATVRAEENGLFRLSDGVLTTVVAVGPAAPKEFENPISTGEILEPLVDATEGSITRVTEGVPNIRRTREGRVAAGRGWIGLPERGAYQVADIRLTSLAPGWLMLVLASALILGAWRIEGR
ncbi:MAG: hypothetical protein AAGE18_16955 [Pseudomonadota bacterium]